MKGIPRIITFAPSSQPCPVVQMCNVALLQRTEVKFLSMHVDRRLTWTKHIKTKRNQLSLKAKQMHLLIERSTLSVEHKLLLCKAELKPAWAYGVQLWGKDLNSNIEILQRFQSKTLRSILHAPWYINNHMYSVLTLSDRASCDH